jgi:hypothetical protein
MPENLSPETAERIRALCGQISVARTIDEEIRQELYSHMEDKFLGYLRGEEKITEEEAFILVREHFGKPEQIRALLEEVYREEDTVGFFRKLGAIFLVTFLTTSLLKFCLDFLIWSISPKFWQSVKLLNYLKIESMLAFDLEFFSSFSLFVFILYRWWKGIKNGRELWFVKLNPWIYMILTFSLTLILPVILVKLLPRGYQYPAYTIPGKGVHFEFLLSYILICLAWIWWFNEPVKRIRHIVIGFISWFYFSFLGEHYIGAIMLAVRNHQENIPHYILRETFQYLNIFHLFSINVFFEQYDFIACGLAAVGFYALYAAGLNGRKKTKTGVIRS